MSAEVSEWMRAIFEAWAKESIPKLFIKHVPKMPFARRGNGQYAWIHARFAFSAWQAAEEHVRHCPSAAASLDIEQFFEHWPEIGNIPQALKVVIFRFAEGWRKANESALASAAKDCGCGLTDKCPVGPSESTPPHKEGK